MILSSGALASWLAIAALVAYGLAAWLRRENSRVDAVALAVGWVAHGLALVVDIAGAGQGARLGFAPVLSITVWLVLLVHAIESRMLPLPAVRRVLALAGCAAVALAWAFPGEVRLASHSPWAPVHFVLGVVSYGLFGVAVLHAWMLDSADRRLRNRASGEGTVLGLPLLRLERLTFGFVEAGFIVLTLALVLGVLTATRWRWDPQDGVLVARLGGVRGFVVGASVARLARSPGDAVVVLRRCVAVAGLCGFTLCARGHPRALGVLILSSRD